MSDKVWSIIFATTVISIVLIALFLVVTFSSTEQEGSVLNTRIEGTRMERVIDEEAGVVCFFFGGGLDCMLITETRLEQ